MGDEIILTNEDNEIAATYTDRVLGMHTGLFHYSKIFVMKILTPFMPKIKEIVEKYYDEVLSRNGLAFQAIVSDFEKYDQDSGKSSGMVCGLSRKGFYILIAKFIICLYEYDTYYKERIDYALKTMIQRREQLHFDDISDPDNWYPNRKRVHKVML